MKTQLHSHPELGNLVRNAIAHGEVTVGPGEVDGVRAISARKVRIDMKTGTLPLPAGKDSYDIYQATVSQNHGKLKLTNVQNIGAVALATVGRTVKPGTTVIIGDATGADKGEMSNKSIRIGTLEAGPDGAPKNAHNHLVVFSSRGKPTRVIDEADAKKVG
ncbi:MAG: hypothetical protein U1E65_22520 [Myxococcota bacterium]